MKRILLILLLLTTSITFSQEKLTNQSIIELVELGFDKDLIITKIQNSDTNFDSSISELKKLKGLNVPNEVIKLMMEKPKKDSKEESIPKSNDSFTYNGVTYKTIKIGNQVWMANNLNFQYGDSETLDSSCYENDEENCKKYGRLYRWNEAMEIADNIPGWHLPSNEEWNILVKELGGKEKAGNIMKTGGFQILFGGSRKNTEAFKYIEMGTNATFWTSTMSNKEKKKDKNRFLGRIATARNLNAEFDSELIYGNANTNRQLSVRLIKDSE